MVTLSDVAKVRIFAYRRSIHFGKGTGAELDHVVVIAGETEHGHVGKASRPVQNDVVRFSTFRHQIGRHGHSGDDLQRTRVDYCEREGARYRSVI